MVGKVVKGLGVVVVVLGLMGGGAVVWAQQEAGRLLSDKIKLAGHVVPQPWPLSAEERASVTAERAASVPPGTDPLAGVNLDALARERAIARGKHLAEARFACLECHGQDFGGGVMVDDPLIGELRGPNLTAGKGGVVAGYTMEDWDLMVRHGVKPDGTPGVMPSEDFLRMSNQELSDLVTYIRSVPPVDREVPKVTLGPLGSWLLATGEMRLTALHAEHATVHPELPPPAAPDATFGAHLIQVCTGCHGSEVRGGPIPGGPPHWAPAANLRNAPDGIGDWTFEQFVVAMKEGRRPNGAALREPMTVIPKYAANMSDLELRAMWAWLREQR